ncbi:uncharacterized protein O9250_004051 isoform 1-T1 [Rhynochetos jubatus]
MSPSTPHSRRVLPKQGIHAQIWKNTPVGTLSITHQNKYETHGKLQPPAGRGTKASRPNSSETRHVLQPLRVPSIFRVWGQGFSTAQNHSFGKGLPEAAPKPRRSRGPSLLPGSHKALAGLYSLLQSQAAPSHSLAQLQGTGQGLRSGYSVSWLSGWGGQVCLWF